MNYCLYCHEAFYEPVSWRFIAGLSEVMLFCEECTSSLQAINGEFCEICGRSFTLFPEQYRQKQCCTDCIRWEESKEWSGVVTKNRSLYVYNDFLKQIISTLKYRGDAKLIQGFRTPFQKLYKQEFRGMLIVPIPLSEERHYERGFNQAMLLAELLGGELLFLLERVIHEKKQSKKSRKERMDIKENIFQASKEAEKIRGQSVLLIDDVYTTGATIRQAAKVMLEAGACEVSSMTVGR
ncbi:phosphoribosyltransferase family protein [Fictibacillus enclensis]|uniref:ComF family protein n=1 Tax=Fictibacillus enclensis TaxID=1017270 RepID=UPI0025A29B1D|nr:phosphoribosyltransferase family protein [Fictibacillus enclensis]MDM5340073.1 phosphoribosyltransferase family protein [Fictibacillus enclensis]